MRRAVSDFSRELMACAAVALIAMGGLVSLGGAVPAAATGGCSGYGEDITGNVTGRLSGDQKRLDVYSSDRAYRITAVGVQGGGDTRVYTGGFSAMTAPPKPGGNTPAISGWYACGSRVTPTIQPSPPPESPKPTTRPRPTDSPSATPTETGSPTGTPEPTDTPTDSPSGTPGPTDSPSDSPSGSPTDTPAASDAPTTDPAVPVPTDIPAGLPGDATGGSRMLVILGVGAMAAGAAALLARRQRAHG